MKKFNLKEAAKNLNEKLKNDKKFKARFATLTVAGVIVVATAITVPTVVHNNKIKAEENTTNVAVQAEPETETTTLPDGIETTVDAEGHVVPVTDESGNFVYTTATPETTIAAIESTAANVNNNTNNTAPPIAASENGKNVGLDESSAAGCNITFSDPLFNDSGVCYFTITPKAGYTLSDSYTVKVGTEVLSAKNNYNAKTGQWFFWSNKIMTDYTIHVEGVSPAA